MISNKGVQNVLGCLSQDSRETPIRELLLESFYQVSTDMVHIIISAERTLVSQARVACRPLGLRGDTRLELISLVEASVSANGADINHSVAKLDEGTTLFRNLQVRDVFKAEVDQLLVSFLSNPLNEAGSSERLSQTKSSQTVLREAKVKEGCDVCCS